MKNNFSRSTSHNSLLQKIIFNTHFLRQSFQRNFVVKSIKITVFSKVPIFLTAYFLKSRRYAVKNTLEKILKKPNLFSTFPKGGVSRVVVSI